MPAYSRNLVRTTTTRTITRRHWWRYWNDRARGARARSPRHCALEQMAESQLRAELMAEQFRPEAKQWFERCQTPMMPSRASEEPGRPDKTFGKPQEARWRRRVLRITVLRPKLTLDGVQTYLALSRRSSIGCPLIDCASDLVSER